MARTWLGGNAAILGVVSLEIDHVTKRFGSTTALDRLTFEVGRGEVFGFLGANGAGKTTTMRICLGIVRGGRGRDPLGRPADVGVAAPDLGLPARGARAPSADGRPGPARLLRVAVRRCRAERARREATAWLARFRIPEYAGRRAEELSKGNQQKVQFIAAVLHDPEVLLMDEPFTGLDPLNLVLLREAFMELRDRGRTLVFSTHQMEAAEALCESVAIVDHGRLVAGGRLRDLKRASGRRTVRLTVEGDPMPAVARGAARRCGRRARAPTAPSSSCCPAPTRRRSSAAIVAEGALGDAVRPRGAQPGGALHRARRSTVR